MRLERLSLTDYRAFRAASLELPQYGFTLIAGPNNSGKSALVSALAVVGGAPVREASCHALGVEWVIKAKFGLSSSEKSDLWQELGWPEELLDSHLFEWVEWEFREWKPEEPAYVSGIFAPALDGSSSEIARISMEESAFSWERQIRPLEDALKLPWRRSERSWAAKGTMSGGPGRTIEYLNYHDHKIDLGSLMDQWRGNTFCFSAIRRGANHFDDLRSDRTLAPDGSNLAAVLLDMKINRPQLWEECQQLAAQPGCTELILT